MHKNWHSFSVEQTIKELRSSHSGLSEKEAKKRLKKYGPNKLPTGKSYSRWQLFLDQLKSPLIYVLIIAGLITFFLEHYTDTIVIFGAVAINTIIGFTQENKASQALSKLKKLVRPEAIVVRDGNQKQVAASQLVSGDIITIKPGDKIPADGRLVEVNNLRINEAALTGEWLPAIKHENKLDPKTPLADRDNMVFMGTIVEGGLGLAIVVNTGSQTQLGNIASLVKETQEEKTPFQKRLASFAKILSIVFGSICILIYGIGILSGRPAIEMFEIAVAIAVSAIPEGLPASMTVILAVGVQRILKKKGLAKTLLATETLGSTSIICTDKTGTLTQAKMVVTNILTGSKELLYSGKKLKESYSIDGKDSHILALKIAALCNEAFIENPDDLMEKWTVRGRPTDKALLMATIQAGLNKKELEMQSPRLKIWPFNIERKLIVSLHKQSKGFQIYASGAPEKILDMSTHLHDEQAIEKLTSEKIKELKNKYESLTKNGLRVVAVGYRLLKASAFDQPLNKKTLEELELEDKHFKGFVFVGFIALKDPLRKEVKEAVKLCRQAGMRVIIVTGDHRLTAKAIAEELKLSTKKDNIIEGKQLDQMSDEEFQKRINKIEVYARVEPKHKLRIVEAWQKRNEVVAMTGDGINDAPALKRADIGVALGSGTDVAKETSDLILLNDNFSIIVAAVEQGRVLLDNLKKVIVYLLSDSFSEIILICGSLVMGLPLPLAAVQILWINLVKDGLPGLALAFEPQEKDIMKRKPMPKKAPLLDKEMKTIILTISIVTSLVLFALFLWLLNHGFDKAHIQTMIFASLGIGSSFYVFSCKSLRQPIWKMNLFDNIYLIGSVFIGFLLLLSAIYVPFLQKLLRTVALTNWYEWAIIISIGLANVVIIEIIKALYITKSKKSKQ